MGDKYEEDYIYQTQYENEGIDHVTASQIIRAYGVQPIMEAPSMEEITTRNVDSHLSNQFTRGDNRQFSLLLRSNSIHGSKPQQLRQGIELNNIILPQKSYGGNSSTTNTIGLAPVAVNIQSKQLPFADEDLPKNSSGLSPTNQMDPPLYSFNQLVIEKSQSFPKNKCSNCQGSDGFKYRFQPTWKTHASALGLAIVGLPCCLCFIPYYFEEKFYQRMILYCSKCGRDSQYQ